MNILLQSSTRPKSICESQQHNNINGMQSCWRPWMASGAWPHGSMRGRLLFSRVCGCQESRHFHIRNQTVYPFILRIILFLLSCPWLELLSLNLFNTALFHSITCRRSGEYGKALDCRLQAIHENIVKQTGLSPKCCRKSAWKGSWSVISINYKLYIIHFIIILIRIMTTTILADAF